MGDRLLAGLLEPTGGSVCASEWSKGVGLVSTELHLASCERHKRSLARAVIQGTHTHQPPTASVEAAAELFGVEACLDKLFGFLSQGQQKLCLCAAAIVFGPSVLVLDEVNHGLDPANCMRVRQVWELISSLTPICVVQITHVSDDVSDCCSHVLRLRQGEVTAMRSVMSRQDALSSFVSHDSKL